MSGVTDRNEPHKEVMNVVPSFLQNFVEPDANMDLLGYRIIPRGKIVQAMSKSVFKKLHGEGSFYVHPGDAKLCDVDGSFRVVPIFFYPNFISWRSTKDPDPNPIIDSSDDARSILAERCRNPKTWEFKYGNGFIGRNAEHLNFVCEVRDPENPHNGLQFVLSFSRGGHKEGKQLATLLTTRRVNKQVIPYYLQVWELFITPRKKDSYEWWGLDFRNPTQGPAFAETEAEAEYFKGLNANLRADFISKRIVLSGLADDDGDGMDETGTMPNDETIPF